MKRREINTPQRRAEYAAHILSFGRDVETVAASAAAAICLREQVIADLEDQLRELLALSGGEG